MRLKLQTTGVLIVAGSEANPLDVMVQNLSANNVYISVSGPIDSTGQGALISSGQSYSNNCLSGPLYALASVADSEIDLEFQKSWIALHTARRY